MRVNRFVALATGLSRRAADKAIESKQVTVNGSPATPGDVISESDKVVFNGKVLDFGLTVATKPQLVMLNKPIGYVCSRAGQGSKTIYDLLPLELHHTKPVGRLDKNSSGLLLLTNDGQLTQELTHPKFHKRKVYDVELDKLLSAEDQRKIELGIKLEDGLSKLQLKGMDKAWRVTMYEGRNRQIRRTFAALGYNVAKLHRTNFGTYELGDLMTGRFQLILA